jgi:hypothetical protein
MAETQMDAQRMLSKSNGFEYQFEKSTEICSPCCPASGSKMSRTESSAAVVVFGDPVYLYVDMLASQIPMIYAAFVNL